MKVLRGLAAIGAMSVAGLPLSPGALAGETSDFWKSVTYSSPALATGEWIAVGGVLYSGEIEAGGIGFIERPANQNRFTPTAAAGGAIPNPTVATLSPTQNTSRAKFEEYGNINPGFWFDHVNFGAVTTDARYFTDFSASHVGNNDQSYWLQWGETGKQYLTIEWDQAPHLYSTTAQSLFGGSSTFLTAPNLSAVCPPPGGGAVNGNTCALAINANLHTINLGIQHDRASAEYRLIATENSEFKVEYSRDHRWGNEETGVVSASVAAIPASSAGTTAMQVPMPISDTTQNAAATYQYTGMSPWNMRFTANAQYSVSVFHNDLTSFDVQNPFLAPTGGNGVGGQPTIGYLNQYSLYPDNMAQAFTGTVGADLPGKSRYMGTFSYTQMRQNELFMAPTVSPFVTGPAGTVVATGTIASIVPPRNSLNGGIDTILFNNVLTTQLTPDLKSKLTYRYYDFDNKTARFLMNDWIVGDTQAANNAAISFAPHASQFSSQTKQNAGAELTWRASPGVTTGLAYGWEHIDYTLANASSTDENFGRVFLDSKQTDWATLRMSYQYGVRTNQNYNYFNNVFAAITNQFTGCTVTTTTVLGTCAGGTGLNISPLERVFMMADRVRQKANVYLDMDVAPGFTITPTIGLKYDHYNDSPNPLLNAAAGGPCPGGGGCTVVTTVNTIGLKNDNDVNMGVDFVGQLTSNSKLFISYMYEKIHRNVWWGTGNTGCMAIPCPAGQSLTALASYTNQAVDDIVHTFGIKTNIELMPRTLDLTLGYSVSWSSENGGGVNCAGAAATCGAIVTPNNVTGVTNLYQLYDAVLKYKFNQDQLRVWGWNGQGYMKLRYVYETNKAFNWQTDNMMPYMFAISNQTFWMAGDNPNYRAQMLMATLGLTW